MLTIHHLATSQSERIIWLCEELAIPFELKHYQRDSVTRLAPPELKEVHPLGSAPVITDGHLVLAESAAIVEFIVAKYGGGRLELGPEHPEFANCLYWFHFANGNLQPKIVQNLLLNRLSLPSEHPIVVSTRSRLIRVFELLDARLREVPCLAGEFTVADIMLVFSLTTMRLFLPFDLAPYENIKAYLKRMGDRPAYRRAMAKGDPDLVPMLA